MADVREKLVDLLCEAHSKATDADAFDDATYAQQLEMEADRLIANGVTIQRWIPVTERLPERWNTVLTLRGQGDETEVSLEWIRSGGSWRDDSRHNPEVTHWMPLPNLPEVGHG